MHLQERRVVLYNTDFHFLQGGSKAFSGSGLSRTLALLRILHTVDWEILVVKKFSSTIFSDEY